MGIIKKIAQVIVGAVIALAGVAAVILVACGPYILIGYVLMWLAGVV